MSYRIEAEWIVEDREAAFRLAESLMLMGAETSSCAPLHEVHARTEQIIGWRSAAEQGVTP